MIFWEQSPFAPTEAKEITDPVELKKNRERRMKLAELAGLNPEDLELNED